MTEPMDIISLGAGVQSSTMALMAARGEFERFGYGMPHCAIFADTQAEPKSVYDWLDWLEGEFPFPVYRVTAGSLTERALSHRTNRKTGKLYYSNMIPAFVSTPSNANRGRVSRHCTFDYKLKPLLRKQRELAQVPRGCKEVRVRSWIGISLDEVRRMKPSRDPWAQNVWPLIDARISRAECINWMESQGYPKPPRSACVYCPFHSNNEWRRLRDEEPEEFALAVQFEKDLQRTHTNIVSNGKLVGVPYLHKSLVPLDQVDLSTDTERGQMTLWDNECEGMCGV